jgi:hypothetical protein
MVPGAIDDLVKLVGLIIGELIFSILRQPDFISPNPVLDGLKDPEQALQ